jgi:hypothetical protein
VNDEPDTMPPPGPDRRRWIIIASAIGVVVATALLLALWPRGSDVEDVAETLADALSDGDRDAFQSVLCKNISPKPTWPAKQLESVESVDVSVTEVEDLGPDSMIIPSATLVVDDTDISFSVAIQKYNTMIRDTPCVFMIDQNSG